MRNPTSSTSTGNPRLGGDDDEGPILVDRTEHVIDETTTALEDEELLLQQEREEREQEELFQKQRSADRGSRTGGAPAKGPGGTTSASASRESSKQFPTGGSAVGLGQISDGDSQQQQLQQLSQSGSPTGAPDHHPLLDGQIKLTQQPLSDHDSGESTTSEDHLNDVFEIRDFTAVSPLEKLSRELQLIVKGWSSHFKSTSGCLTSVVDCRDTAQCLKLLEQMRRNSGGTFSAAGGKTSANIAKTNQNLPSPAASVLIDHQEKEFKALTLQFQQALQFYSEHKSSQGRMIARFRFNNMKYHLHVYYGRPVPLNVTDELFHRFTNHIAGGGGGLRLVVGGGPTTTGAAKSSTGIIAASSSATSTAPAFPPVLKELADLLAQEQKFPVKCHPNTRRFGVRQFIMVTRERESQEISNDSANFLLSAMLIAVRAAFPTAGFKSLECGRKARGAVQLAASSSRGPGAKALNKNNIKAGRTRTSTSSSTSPASGTTTIAVPTTSSFSDTALDIPCFVNQNPGEGVNGKTIGEGFFLLPDKKTALRRNFLSCARSSRHVDPLLKDLPGLLIFWESLRNKVPREVNLKYRKDCTWTKAEHLTELFHACSRTDVSGAATVASSSTAAFMFPQLQQPVENYTGKTSKSLTPRELVRVQHGPQIRARFVYLCEEFDAMNYDPIVGKTLELMQLFCLWGPFSKGDYFGTTGMYDEEDEVELVLSSSTAAQEQEEPGSSPQKSPAAGPAVVPGGEDLPVAPVPGILTTDRVDEQDPDRGLANHLLEKETTSKTTSSKGSDPAETVTLTAPPADFSPNKPAPPPPPPPPPPPSSLPAATRTNQDDTKEQRPSVASSVPSNLSRSQQQQQHPPNTDDEEEDFLNPYKAQVWQFRVTCTEAEKRRSWIREHIEYFLDFESETSDTESLTQFLGTTTGSTASGQRLKNQNTEQQTGFGLTALGLHLANAYQDFILPSENEQLKILDSCFTRIRSNTDAIVYDQVMELFHQYESQCIDTRRIVSQENHNFRESEKTEILEDWEGHSYRSFVDALESTLGGLCIEADVDKDNLLEKSRSKSNSPFENRAERSGSAPPSATTRGANMVSTSTSTRSFTSTLRTLNDLHKITQTSLKGAPAILSTLLEEIVVRKGVLNFRAICTMYFKLVQRIRLFWNERLLNGASAVASKAAADAQPGAGVGGAAGALGSEQQQFSQPWFVTNDLGQRISPPTLEIDEDAAAEAKLTAKRKRRALADLGLRRANVTDFQNCLLYQKFHVVFYCIEAEKSASNRRGLEDSVEFIRNLSATSSSSGTTTGAGGAILNGIQTGLNTPMSSTTAPDTTPGREETNYSPPVSERSDQHQPPSSASSGIVHVQHDNVPPGGGGLQLPEGTRSGDKKQTATTRTTTPEHQNRSKTKIEGGILETAFFSHSSSTTSSGIVNATSGASTARNKHDRGSSSTRSSSSTSIKRMNKRTAAPEQQFPVKKSTDIPIAIAPLIAEDTLGRKKQALGPLLEKAKIARAKTTKAATPIPSQRTDMITKGTSSSSTAGASRNYKLSFPAKKPANKLSRRQRENLALLVRLQQQVPKLDCEQFLMNFAAKTKSQTSPNQEDFVKWYTGICDFFDDQELALLKGVFAEVLCEQECPLPIYNFPQEPENLDHLVAHPQSTTLSTNSSDPDLAEDKAASEHLKQAIQTANSAKIQHGLVSMKKPESFMMEKEAAGAPGGKNSNSGEVINSSQDSSPSSSRVVVSKTSTDAGATAPVETTQQNGKSSSTSSRTGGGGFIAPSTSSTKIPTFIENLIDPAIFDPEKDAEMSLHYLENVHTRELWSQLFHVVVQVLVKDLVQKHLRLILLYEDFFLEKFLQPLNELLQSIFETAKQEWKKQRLLSMRMGEDNDNEIEDLEDTASFASVSSEEESNLQNEQQVERETENIDVGTAVAPDAKVKDSLAMQLDDIENPFDVDAAPGRGVLEKSSPAAVSSPTETQTRPTQPMLGIVSPPSKKNRGTSSAGATASSSLGSNSAQKTSTRTAQMKNIAEFLPTISSKEVQGPLSSSGARAREHHDESDEKRKINNDSYNNYTEGDLHDDDDDPFPDGSWADSGTNPVPSHRDLEPLLALLDSFSFHLELCVALDNVFSSSSTGGNINDSSLSNIKTATTNGSAGGGYNDHAARNNTSKNSAEQLAKKHLIEQILQNPQRLAKDLDPRKDVFARKILASCFFRKNRSRSVDSTASGLQHMASQSAGNYTTTAGAGTTPGTSGMSHTAAEDHFLLQQQDEGSHDNIVLKKPFVQEFLIEDPFTRVYAEVRDPFTRVATAYAMA
ncbi:unnamed protein product [Amoebophrya sp. A120]|nr:unnamed protein product [Amoebophrya sp. A120]|eukprot:GSA120T00008443001.1